MTSRVLLVPIPVTPLPNRRLCLRRLHSLQTLINFIPTFPILTIVALLHLKRMTFVLLSVVRALLKSRLLQLRSRPPVAPMVLIDLFARTEVQDVGVPNVNAPLLCLLELASAFLKPVTARLLAEKTLPIPRRKQLVLQPLQQVPKSALQLKALLALRA